MVVRSITVRERIGEALQRVGGAHIAADPGDRQLRRRERALLACMSIGMS